MSAATDKIIVRSTKVATDTQPGTFPKKKNTVIAEKPAHLLMGNKHPHSNGLNAFATMRLTHAVDRSLNRGFTVCRWGYTRYCQNFDELTDFVHRLGGQHAFRS